MRLDDDFEEEDDDYISEYEMASKKKVTNLYAIVCASAVILLALVVVFASNSKNNHRYTNQSASNNATATPKGDDYYISGETRVASDLDFWDDYNQTPKPVSDNVVVSVNEALNEENDPSTDGNHTKIVHSDGSEEWIEINKGLPLNDYNFDNLSYKKPFMQYSENNHIVSYEGVDVSKVEDYIDYNALKNAGVDFVMIKLGQRGYSSAELSLDENFEDNIERATAAGLDVGVYFFSQATTTDEAVEEAEFVINAISDNKVTYPVCYYIEPISGVETRNDKISQIQRTNYAKAFLEKISEAGYYPMIYGSKEYLIQKYSLGSLLGTGYDYWLTQEEDIPDYPYNFGMWRYTTKGKVDGISGYANLDICFIDYSIR